MPVTEANHTHHEQLNAEHSVLVRVPCVSVRVTHVQVRFDQHLVQQGEIAVCGVVDVGNAPAVLAPADLRPPCAMWQQNSNNTMCHKFQQCCVSKSPAMQRVSIIQTIQCVSIIPSSAAV